MKNPPLRKATGSILMTGPRAAPYSSDPSAAEAPNQVEGFPSLV